MCGIFAEFPNSGRGNESLSKIRNALANRGPDESNSFLDELSYIYHARLAVIGQDDSSKQPLIKKDKVIVFNGEIYNHKELIEKYNLGDNSEIELIGHLYDLHGLEIVNYLIGQYAILIYNRCSLEVIFFRDRIGEKPLYFITKNGVLSVGSTEEVLNAAFNFELEINELSIQSHLMYMSHGSGLSYYKNVESVRPGEIIKFNILTGIIQKKKYWNFQLPVQRNSNFLEANERFENYYLNSIKRISQSDAGICVALSSGLDSSLNAIAMKNLGVNFSAVHIFAKCESDNSERMIVEKLCRDYDIDLKLIEVDKKKYWDEYYSLVNSRLCGIIAWPDSVLISLIAKEVKKIGSKVLVVGEGGDELGGYSIYDKFIRRYYFHKILHEASKFLKFDLHNNINNGLFKSPRLRIGLNIDHLARGNFGRLSDLTDDLGVEKIFNIDHGLSIISKAEYEFRLPEILCRRLDRFTMIHSVEARAPFLDIELIEDQHKYSYSSRNNNCLKSNIRALAQKILPEYIITNKKIGFGEDFRRILIEEVDRPVSERLIPYLSTKTYDKSKFTFGQKWLIRSTGDFLDSIQ